jgi:hypothetical protein
MVLDYLLRVRLSGLVVRRIAQLAISPGEVIPMPQLAAPAAKPPDRVARAIEVRKVRVRLAVALSARYLSPADVSPILMVQIWLTPAPSIVGWAACLPAPVPAAAGIEPFFLHDLPAMAAFPQAVIILAPQSVGEAAVSIRSTAVKPGGCSILLPA